DFRIPFQEQSLFWDCLLIVMIVKPVVFVSLGFYRNLWRYASLQDAMELLKGVTLASVTAVFAILYMRQFAPLPRSIFILDWFLLFTMISASRLVWRVFRESYVIPRTTNGPRTLIVGAGEAGSLLLKEIRRQTATLYNVVGFVDDDPEKKGMRLHGLPVLGDTTHLKSLVRIHEIEDVIIAMPSADRFVVRNVLSCCQKARVRFKTLPSISGLIDGSISISQIKDIDIEDLLGRDAVVLDEEGIGNYLTGRKILVTGAGGSIGSEICRQVGRFSPRNIILFENAETPLYHIEKELVAAFPHISIIPVMADVRNSARVAAIFNEFSPEVIFHAAAYKHVPMMEYNPAEAVSNNVLGTKVLADAAQQYKVKHFVMISTDKAVNPTNVMGATKRVAEIYVQALARKSATKFTTVRFGNVLGSNGSVIPHFKEQIKKGGPVTVTDQRVIRYFMTIPEATQLVLQAGCIGTGGEILVLDMGDPVRILDLAEQLIRLSGLVPYEDIDIVFTGLRPGEKLFEELLISGEGIKQTSHKKIKVLAAVASDYEAVAAELDTLFLHASESNIHAVMTALRRIVPEFAPAYTFNGPVPFPFQRLRPDLFPAQGSTVGKVLPIRP
ncbi:MAG: polysaccharide biosynthesis protein, partial [Geobacter sp.]